MKLETMSTKDLDCVVDKESFLQQKQNQIGDMLQKYDTLRSPTLGVDISYSLDLTYDEQVKYANIGMFHYWADLNNRSTVYKDDIGTDKPPV